MNKIELPILVVRMVTSSLLDGEIERSLVAFLDREGQDIDVSAQRLAEEHGSTLLHLNVPESIVLYIADIEDVNHAI